MYSWEGITGKYWLLIVAFLSFFSATAYAASGLAVEGSRIDWPVMIMRLGGGLALFLYGMELMSDALKNVAGDKMKTILGTLTTNRFTGMLTGAGVTAIIQSSSVTTVLLVGFVTAELMTLSQAVGVIIGANIGTTITAQIVAFKVTKYASMMIFVGFMMSFIGKQEKIKQYGLMIMGLGMIFFGMGEMSGAMKPLRSYDPFLDMMQHVSNPIVGILIATAFTGLIQSSSATTGIILAMAMQGLVTLEAGIALSLGANVGTCVTAGLASLKKPPEAVRVAVVHVMFNLVGALVFVGFIPVFSEFVRTISPVYPELNGLDRLAKEAPRQIANAHTMFNVGMAFIFLPLGGLLARFAEWAVPEKKSDGAEVIALSQLLDDNAIKTMPSVALDAAFREICLMGNDVRAMLSTFVNVAASGNKEAMLIAAKNDDLVDNRYRRILAYLRKLQQQSFLPDEARRLELAWKAAEHIEAMGDAMETALQETARKLEDGVNMSVDTIKQLETLHGMVGRVLEAVMSVVTACADSGPGLSPQVKALAQEVLDAKKHVSEGRDEFKIYLRTQRVSSDAQNRETLYGIESMLVESLSKLAYHARRFADSILV